QNATQEVATLIIIAGAPGEEEYGKAFSEWAGLWDKAGAQSGAKTISIGLKAVEGTTDRDRLQKTLETEAKESANELWLVLIGHGTFDGKEAKFNLRGPDVSATELAGWRSFTSSKEGWRPNTPWWMTMAMALAPPLIGFVGFERSSGRRTEHRWMAFGLTNFISFATIPSATCPLPFEPSGMNWNWESQNCGAQRTRWRRKSIIGVWRSFWSK